jgi:hypothetical protein
MAGRERPAEPAIRPAARGGKPSCRVISGIAAVNKALPEPVELSVKPGSLLKHGMAFCTMLWGHENCRRLTGKMSKTASNTIYDEAQEKLVALAHDFMRDMTRWFGQLSDLERLLGLCVFILILFVLVVVKAGRREHAPGKARSFVSSFVLVVTFSFVVGLLLDTPYDPRGFLPADFMSNFV